MVVFFFECIFSDQQFGHVHSCQFVWIDFVFPEYIGNKTRHCRIQQGWMRSHKIFKYFCGLCQIFVYLTENTCRCSQMHILHYIRVTCGKLKNLIFDVLKRVMKGDGKFATDLERKIRAKTDNSIKVNFYLYLFIY